MNRRDLFRWCASAVAWLLGAKATEASPEPQPILFCTLLETIYPEESALARVDYFTGGEWVDSGTEIRVHDKFGFCHLPGTKLWACLDQRTNRYRLVHVQNSECHWENIICMEESP